MYDGRYRVEMKAMLEAGLSNAAIARRLGVSVKTVTRWRKGDARRLERKPRAHKLDPYKGMIRERLRRYPALSAQRLFDEVREAGYDGGYGRVRDYVGGIRPRVEPAPTVRFETAPGAQAQVDFGTFRTAWGRRHALVVVLGHSRLLWLRYYPRQTMTTVMEGLEHAFTYFGGVPEHVLFDQMKAVVVADRRTRGEELLLNERFKHFAAHWGFRIRACRPHRPQTKGKVERSIDYIRRSFHYGREFLNDDDLNAQALGWLERTANRRRCAPLGESPRARFERDERACLQALPGRSYLPAAVKPAAPNDPRPAVAVERRSLAAYAELVR